MKPTNKSNSSQWINLGLVALTLIILLGLSLFLMSWVGSFNSDRLAAFMSGFGAYAILVYLLLMMFAVLTPLPDFLVSVAGGYLFGPILGTILALVGHLLATSYDFWLARRLGRDFVAHKYPGFVQKMDMVARNVGWETVAILRIIPSVSFDFVGYGAGISAIPYLEFMGGTLLGTAPMTVLHNFLGISLRPGYTLTRWITVGLFFGVLIGTSIFQWKRKKRVA